MTAATALSNAEKELTAKKKTAETAKKNLDALISTKQKPAMTEATKAATNLTTAMTNKTKTETAMTARCCECCQTPICDHVRKHSADMVANRRSFTSLPRRLQRGHFDESTLGESGQMFYGWMNHTLQ